MFEARDFLIRDGDTVYVTEAPFVQWQKTISAITGTAGAATTLSAAGTVGRLRQLWPDQSPRSEPPGPFPGGFSFTTPAFCANRACAGSWRLPGMSCAAWACPRPAMAWWSGAAAPMPRAARPWPRARGAAADPDRGCLPALGPARADGRCPARLADRPAAACISMRRRPRGWNDPAATHPLDNSNLLARARDGIARLTGAGFVKIQYSRSRPACAPAPRLCSGGRPDPRRCLDPPFRGAGRDVPRNAGLSPQEENPGARIVIKTHPETALGLRPGHFGAADATGRITPADRSRLALALLEGAIAVYTVSSQLGFEAILAGHRPHVFGQPFYAGWGLSAGRNPVAAPPAQPDPGAAFRRRDDPCPHLV